VKTNTEDNKANRLVGELEKVPLTKRMKIPKNNSDRIGGGGLLWGLRERVKKKK